MSLQYKDGRGRTQLSLVDHLAVISRFVSLLISWFQMELWQHRKRRDVNAALIASQTCSMQTRHPSRLYE
eukprot:4031789-Amphidinium_carterae.1